MKKTEIKCSDCKESETEIFGLNVYCKKCGRWLDEAENNNKYETKCVLCRKKFLTKKGTNIEDICPDCKKVM